MTKVASIVAAIAVGVCIGGCSGAENPEPRPVVYNFVTYESTLADGSVSTFTYQVAGDSPVVTLSARWVVPEGVVPGTRLLLGYVPESQTTESGAVELTGYSILPGGKVKSAELIPESESMRLNSMWRSGNYLNLDAMVSFSGQPSEISLYAEPRTAGPAEAQVRVVIGKADGELEEAAERRLYASWDISSLWGNPELETLTVTYSGANNEYETIKLKK